MASPNIFAYFFKRKTQKNLEKRDILRILWYNIKKLYTMTGIKNSSSGEWGLAILLAGIVTGVLWLVWQVIKGIFFLLLSVFAYIIGDSPETTNKK